MAMSRIQALKLIQFKMAVRAVVHNVQEWAVAAVRVVRRMGAVQQVAVIAATAAHAARLMVNAVRQAHRLAVVAVIQANKRYLLGITASIH